MHPATAHAEPSATAGADVAAAAARGTVLRAAGSVVCAAAALLAVVGISHARALDARLGRMALAPGGDVSGAPDPSAPGPFTPFAFGVVGPVRGDAAALERRVEALARAGAAFVVLVGDVTGDGSPADVRRLASAARDRGVEVVAVPGRADLASPHFPTWICAPRWWFRHRDVVFVGVPGASPDDAAWLADRRAQVRAPHATVVITSETGSAVPSDPGTAVFGPDPGTRLVRVTADGFTVEPVAAAHAASVRDAAGTVARHAALALAPWVRAPAAHVAALAAATLLLAWSGFGWRVRGVAGRSA